MLLYTELCYQYRDSVFVTGYIIHVCVLALSARQSTLDYVDPDTVPLRYLKLGKHQHSLL